MCQRPCGCLSHARMGGGRRRPVRATGPRYRGDGPVLTCPIDRRLRLCVHVHVDTQHLFVVVRRRSCVALGVRRRCVLLLLLLLLLWLSVVRDSIWWWRSAVVPRRPLRRPRQPRPRPSCRLRRRAKPRWPTKPQPRPRPRPHVCEAGDRTAGRQQADWWANRANMQRNGQTQSRLLGGGSVTGPAFLSEGEKTKSRVFPFFM